MFAVLNIRQSRLNANPQTSHELSTTLLPPVPSYLSESGEDIHLAVSHRFPVCQLPYSCGLSSLDFLLNMSFPSLASLPE